MEIGLRDYGCGDYLLVATGSLIADMPVAEAFTEVRQYPFRLFHSCCM